MKTNRMKSVLGVAVLAVIIAMGTACSSDKTKKDKVESTQQTEAVYQIDDVLQNAPDLLDKEVELEGVCTHICKHGGRKIFLMGSDDKHTLRIEGGSVGSFDQKCVNSIVKVSGKLVETRIDEAYLAAWEEKEKSRTGEKHGEGEAGCSTEKKARGETANSAMDRIAQFRNRINEEKAKTGKDYLSFYHMEASAYSIED